MKRLRILIPAIICVVSVLIMLLSVMLVKSEETAFLPDFEENAVSGEPDSDVVADYADITQDGMAYSVFMCEKIHVFANNADVYFTNIKENTVFLKLRLLSSDGTVLGESGIIRPGEYVKSISVSSLPIDGEQITLKILAYEPDSYYSAGSVSFNTVVYVHD